MSHFAPFLQKIRKHGLTPANVICYLSQRCPFAVGLFWGTLRLRLKAALFGVSLGEKTTAHGTVCLMRWPGGVIHIGNRVHFISSWRRATASSLCAPVKLRVFGQGSSISIGDGCELSGTSITARSTSIRLGKNVLVGPNSVITDSDFHAPWPCTARSENPGTERDREVVISDYVWIGMRCIILKGVHIGTGAVIGAGSVVTRDIPPYSVACGNPCRVVKQLAPPVAEKQGLQDRV
ncbi:MAG: acyltransferase [Desulfovibrio sp.]|nr:acyltransferase [Desulfovibrio sp.]